MEEFLVLHDEQKLFPKLCRSCGEEFLSFSEYLCMTTPKGHGLEDCSRTMKRPYTLCYRHCGCGNTLVLALTGEVFPKLDEFWSTLRDVSEEMGVPLAEVVELYVRHCEKHMLSTNPCGKGRLR